MISLAACAGPPAPVGVGVDGASTPTTVAFRMQPEVPRGGLSGSFGVDHIAIDGGGAYVCVLRRGGDLASLRARYNPRS